MFFRENHSSFRGDRLSGVIDRASLLLVAFLFLVVRPGAPSSVLVTSSDALVPTSKALVPNSFLLLVHSEVASLV